MSQNPHAILVHGAWVGGWEFSPVVPALQSLGWTVETVELPSTGSTGSMTADADAVTAALDRAEGPVILVGHSYGGVPVTQAGAHPAVAALVYVAAFALDVGESVHGAVGGQLPPDWHVADGQVSLGAGRAERIALVAADFPPGTPPEAAERLADLFRPQSLAALTDPVTEAAWRTKPSWYLLTEKDVLVPPAFQQTLAERADAEIVRVPTGHAPFQEDPAAFVDVLVRIADRVYGAAPERLFIGGQWREAADGGLMDIVGPATGRVVARVARGTTADVDAAVAAAREAFDSGPWPRMSSRERARILQRAYALLREHAEELAQTESLDVGKPISFARAVDVNNAVDLYEYYASLGHRLDGEVRETTGATHAYVRHEPIGVVAAITPFNFPLILSSTKIAPALIAGNTIVHKPAGDTPLSALLVARLLQEAGVPDGVVNVVTGPGALLGDHLVGHPDVDKVAFTGSTQVGSHAAALAGRTLKPFTAELGGNAANILFADADLHTAVRTVISAFVFNTGQFCMAGPRLLVERPLYDTVLGILADAVPQVPFGDPADAATVIGPLASAAQLDKVSALVDRARAAGARIVTGGERADLGGGFFYRPTVIADVDNDAEIVAEEVFGPVLTVQPFDTEEQAIALANSTPYGLASGIQTSDLAKAHRVAARLRAGITWVNGWALLDPAVPFGGVKASGWGREGGPEALASYQQSHAIVFDLAPGAAR